MIAKAILTFFLLAGATPPQARALLHHAQVESGLSLQYCVKGPGGSGLFQWVGARRLRLAVWSQTRGCPSLERQLSFALLELREPAFRCFWRSRSEAEAFAVLRRTFGRGGSC